VHGPGDAEVHRLVYDEIVIWAAVLLVRELRAALLGHGHARALASGARG
jgi:hypothetical protein